MYLPVRGFQDSVSFSVGELYAPVQHPASLIIPWTVASSPAGFPYEQPHSLGNVKSMATEHFSTVFVPLRCIIGPHVLPKIGIIATTSAGNSLVMLTDSLNAPLTQVSQQLYIYQ